MSTPIQYCDVCPEHAAGTCTRCGRSLCAEHDRTPEVCDGCEADFAHRTSALIKPQPKPLRGAFKTTVAYPSLTIGALSGLTALLAGIYRGNLDIIAWTPAIALAFGLFIAALTLPVYLMLGTPIFLRRKLKAAAQETRLRLARRSFDKERHQNNAVREEQEEE